MTGPEEEAEIASLAVHNNDIFASAGPKVVRYQRGKQVAVYKAGVSDVKLGQILIFGEQLLALRQDGRGMLVWKISTLGTLSTEFKLSKRLTYRITQNWKVKSTFIRLSPLRPCFIPQLTSTK